ncbi:hypothetical protein NDU88_002411 [Pleurodeles waltl]|uniref:Uncharacterized protein n=1 Tax=Pleurodeles waltl TaxID=8319 RepID=A0AAV7MSP3_PLEWA|nr:hypothetical protein NDU88_002411 [Pleurodeles waltl]
MRAGRAKKQSAAEKRLSSRGPKIAIEGQKRYINDSGVVRKVWETPLPPSGRVYRSRIRAPGPRRRPAAPTASMTADQEAQQTARCLRSGRDTRCAATAAGDDCHVDEY